MNEDIYNELRFYINAEGKDVSATEQTKILSDATKILSSVAYMDEIKTRFGVLLNEPSFNIMVDFGEILKIVINLNQMCDHYKDLTIDRLRFIMYGVIYSTIHKNYPNILNNISMSDFRMLYSNSMSLILIPIDTVKISKEDCINCVARTFKFFSWLENKLKI